MGLTLNFVRLVFVFTHTKVSARKRGIWRLLRLIVEWRAKHAEMGRNGVPLSYEKKTRASYFYSKQAAAAVAAEAEQLLRAWFVSYLYSLLVAWYKAFFCQRSRVSGGAFLYHQDLSTFPSPKQIPLLSKDASFSRAAATAAP